MEQVIKCFRFMGWCWCWNEKRRLTDGYDLEPFLDKRLPVFWVMGPPRCGKTTIATLLARCSDYNLIKISEIIKNETVKHTWRGTVLKETTRDGSPAPDEIVLNLLKEIFNTTCQDSLGYILDGFPINLKQAKQFEFEICKVYIIVYPTLTLDAFLVRSGDWDDAEKLKEEHIHASKLCQEVYRHYEQKTLKCVTIYSTEITMNTLIIDLRRYFGYKFKYVSDLVDT